MARPYKSIETSTGKIGKDKVEERQEAEAVLRGSSNNLKPPTYLSSAQKKIFKYIVAQLKASGILSNLDIYVLTTCSIAIDRLQGIETLINEDIQNLKNKDLMSSKDKYTKDFFRCCNELSLSPQARAKIGNLNLQSQGKAEDPLLQILAKNKSGEGG